MAGPARTGPEVVDDEKARFGPGEEPNVREGGGLGVLFWASRRPKTQRTWPD